MKINNHFILNRDLISLKARKNVLEDAINNTDCPIQKAKMSAEIMRINSKIKREELISH